MAYRGNNRLNEKIESFISQWHGTVFGYQIRNAYENGTSYEGICEMIGINYEDYEACEE